MGYGHCFFKQSLHEQVNEQALHLTFWLSGPHSENKQHKMNKCGQRQLSLTQEPEGMHTFWSF